MPYTKHIPKGHVFFKEHTEGGMAFLLRSGKVEISRMIGDKKMVLAILGPGEIFGEMALLGVQRRTATATALEECKVVTISRPKLLSLLYKTNPFVRLLILSLVRRLKETDERLRPQLSNHPYMSVCRLLALMMPDDRRSRLPAQLNYDEVIEQIKAILALSAGDCVQILEKLEKLNLIQILPGDDGERVILFKHDKSEFLAQIEGLFAELPDMFSEAAAQTTEFIDIRDLAAHIGVPPNRIYRKLASGEIPEELFFFPREHVIKWAEQQGRSFFEKPTTLGIKPDDVEALEDLMYLDEHTLQTLLDQLEIYEICVLLKRASEKVRRRVYACLSPRIASVVQHELKLIEYIEEEEAERIERTVLDQVKTLKAS